MSTLVITLPLATPGPADRYDYTLSADGHGVTRQGDAGAALLPAAGRTGETVALVPLRALSWHRVTLPPGVLAQPARLRAALEGLLEEHLLDDPAALHFALEPGAQAGRPVWVAACDRAWLRGALQALETAGRPADRVVPEFAPGPTASGQAELSVLGTAEDAQLVLAGQGEAQALLMLPLAAAPGLELALPAHAEGAPPVRAEPAVAALAEHALARPVALQTAGERALAAARGAWDLAQLDLASSGGRRALRKAAAAANTLLRAPQWRAARWGLALALVAQVAGLNLWAWADRQQLAAKQASVRELLTQTFPQVQVVVDAPVQMERELARLRQAAGGVSARDLEPLLAAAAAALAPGRLPTGIEYAGGELQLSGITLAPDELAGVQQRLAASGAGASVPQAGTLALRPQAPGQGPAR